MFTAWLLLLKQNKSGDTCALTPNFYSHTGTKSRFAPEHIDIDLIPDNSLYDSAQTGGQQAYELLWKSGYCRLGYTLRFNLEKQLEDNLTGHSSDLVFALAASAVLLNRTGSVRPFAATGVLQDFAVLNVDGVSAKITAALAVMPEDSIIFYPAANNPGISAGLQQQATAKNIVLFPVERLEQAISELFGIIIEFWCDIPYQGLEVFTYHHRLIYFGRQTEAELLRKHLLEQEKIKPPRLLILGGSGSGKSSFVQAGLIPELKKQFGNTLSLKYAIWRPQFANGIRTEASLVQSITAQLINPAEAKPATRFTELAAILGKQTFPENTRCLWIIDQLEEIFTLCPTEVLPGFVAFLKQLENLNHFWLIATFRNDFYPQYQSHFSEIFDHDNCYNLPRLNTAALDQIIQAPADLAKISFEDQGGINLALQLREDMAGETEALPLLEFCLRELYEQRDKESRMMTYAAYKKMGGLHGAIGKQAEAVFNTLPSASKNTLPEVLWRLAVWNSVNNRLSAQSTPVTDFSNPAQELLDAFVKERLFVREQYLVRVTHEALLTHWLRANEELETLAADSRIYQRLKDLATPWHKDKDSSRLLPAGLPLAEAEDLLARRKVMLEPMVLEFIEASVEAEQERQERDARLLKEARLREAKLVWLPKAKQAFAQRIYPDCVLYAARALGFRGYGYEELSPEQQKVFDEEYPVLFDFREQTELYQEFREMIDGEVKPMLPFWSSHQLNTTISSIAFSPDGKILASCSETETIKLWDVATGKKLTNLQGDANSIAFSPDGKTLCGSNEDIIKLWDVATRKELKRLCGHKSPISYIAFSPDGKTLASSSFYNTIKLWDVAMGKEILSFDVSKFDGSRIEIDFRPAIIDRDHDPRPERVFWPNDYGDLSRRINSIAFSPNGKTLISAGDDMKLWDISTGKQMVSFNGHTDKVRCVAFSPDGNILASGGNGYDEATILWDVAKNKGLARFDGYTGAICCVVFSPDGKSLARATEKGAIKIWDVAKHKEIANFEAHKSAVTSLVFSPDSRTLASCGRDKTIKFWDIAKGKEIATFNREDKFYTARSPCTFFPKGLVFNSDGKLFIMSRFNYDDIPKFLNVVTGKECLPLNWHIDTNKNIDLRPDTIASVKKIEQSRGIKFSLDSIAFSPDEKILADIGNGYPSLYLWDLVKNKHHASVDVFTDSINCIAFSYDSKILASVSRDNVIELRDVSNGRVLACLKGHNNPIKYIAFSPDGKTLTSTSYKTIKLWDVTTGKELKSIEVHTNYWVNNIAFSPEGKALGVCDDNDKTIKLWDTALGKELLSLTAHDGTDVESIIFSPDNQTIASTSRDYRIIKLWSIEPTKNFACYLIDYWYTFNSETGDIHPGDGCSQPSTNFLNVPPWSHIGIMQSADSPEQANRLLFEHYCRNKIWNAAKLLLNEPMDKPVDADWLNAMPDD